MDVYILLLVTAVSMLVGGLVGFYVGHLRGYLVGKVEASNIIRGEPP